MQPQRLRESERNLSGIAKRVLDAVPIATPWTVGQICTEVGRTGARIDMAIVMGCLRTHVGQGLVREPTALNFIRVQIPEAEPKKALRVVHPQPENTMPLPAHVAKGIADSHTSDNVTEREPLHDIGALAQRLREQGRALIMWAEDLERLALEYEGRVEAAGQDGKQLAQLRNILKNLGV